MELIEIMGIALMIVGFIFAVAEMLIPGFGLPGIAGGICMIAGLFMKARTIEEGLTLAVILIVALAVALTIIIVFFRSGKIKPPFELDEQVKATKMFLGAEDMEYLVGKCGTATTDLRPAGKMEIEGVELDVRSESFFIEKGTKIQVVRIQNGSIIVK